MNHINLNQGEVQMSWWLEVITKKPYCIYYFGPFASSEEAAVAQSGYIEDLTEENAEGIDSQIKFDNPSNLTIYHDDLGMDDMLMCI